MLPIGVQDEAVEPASLRALAQALEATAYSAGGISGMATGIPNSGRSTSRRRGVLIGRAAP